MTLSEVTIITIKEIPPRWDEWVDLSSVYLMSRNVSVAIFSVVSLHFWWQITASPWHANKDYFLFHSGWKYRWCEMEDTLTCSRTVRCTINMNVVSINFVRFIISILQFVANIENKTAIRQYAIVMGAVMRSYIKGCLYECNGCARIIYICGRYTHTYIFSKIGMWLHVLRVATAIVTHRTSHSQMTPILFDGVKIKKNINLNSSMNTFLHGRKDYTDYFLNVYILYQERGVKSRHVLIKSH